MSDVKNKRVLTSIAKEWCKGILLACEGDAFSDAIEKELINEEEASYIIAKAHEIANKITKQPYIPELNAIIEKYFEIEEVEEK